MAFAQSDRELEEGFEQRRDLTQLNLSGCRAKMNWAQSMDRSEIRIVMCSVEPVIVAGGWSGGRFLM